MFSFCLSQTKELYNCSWSSRMRVFASCVSGIPAVKSHLFSHYLSFVSQTLLQPLEEFAVTYEHFLPTVPSNRWQYDVFGRKCMTSWEEVQVAPAPLLVLADTMRSENWLGFQIICQFDHFFNHFIIIHLFAQVGAALWKAHKRRGGQTTASKQTTKAI